MDALEVIIPKMKRIEPSTAVETFAELARIGISNPIAALVQVASSLDADALERAIELLEELLEDFGVFLETDLNQEIQSQVNFDNLMAEIAELRKQTKAKKANDETELSETVATLGSQQRRLSENTEALGNATDGLEAKTTECDLYDSNYERDTAQRNGELEILDKVASIIASRLQGLQTFIEMRGD